MFSYSSPAIATYLNIASPIAACVNGNKVAVLNSEGVWEVENGVKKLIPNSYYDARDCAGIDSKTYVLAVPTGLVKIKTDGTTQTIVESAAKSRTRVKFLGDKWVVHQSVNTLSIYDTNLNFKAKKDYQVTEVTDFEYKDNYLYISGFQQQKRSGIPVQIAFLYRMGFDGTSLFNLPNVSGNNQGKLWGYNAASLVDNMADTRLNRLYISGDKLYALGSVYGGNSIYRWNGKDLLTQTLITTDKYTNAAQTRDETKVYTGVIDLTSFTVERGQLSLTRLPSTTGLGDGNSNFPKTIYSDGTDIFVGSTAAYAIPNRDSQTFLGKSIASYRGDASFLIFPNDLNTRKAWVTPGNGEVLLFNNQFAVIKTGDVNDLTTNSGTAQTLPTNTYFIKF